MAAEDVKQVIVMRNDLGMRKGKQIAQGSHASIKFMAERVAHINRPKWSDVEKQWLQGSFAKICVRVDSEEELMEIHDKAKCAGLETHLIIDSGKTEFHGVPTKTCLAIGPDVASKIDAITGELRLL
jgi:PTH2 family peptidyl-tRNA hydrolase